MGQGEFFALTAKELAELLRGGSGGSDPMGAIMDIQDAWPEDRRLPVWKNWDVLHCCLSDGSFNPRGGSYPLNHTILGGQHLSQRDDGYTAVVVTAEQVRDVAGALDRVHESWLRERYQRLFGAEYDGPIPSDHLEGLVELFGAIRIFYGDAARQGYAILFTTDELMKDLYPSDQI